MRGGRRRRKRGERGVEGGRGCSYVLSDPPVRSRTPFPQPWLLCSIGDLLLLLLLVFGGLFSCRMTGGPAPTPNSPVSNTQFGFIVLPAQTEIFCRVKQWSCELPGSSACFSTSVPFCLSVCLLHPFLNSLGPRTPPTPSLPNLPSPLYNQPSSRLICVVEVSLAGGTLLFSVLKRSQFDFSDLDVSVRACAGSVYITCPNEREYYCFVKLYKGEEIPHSCFFLSSFVA